MFQNRKFLILFFYLFTFSAQSVFAQDTTAQSRFNINMSPVGFILGLYNLGVDVAVTPNITIGASGLLASFDSTEAEIDGSGFGVRSTYFFNQVFQDSWYATFDLATLGIDGEDKDTLETASLDAISTSLKLGYFWRWTNFNIQLGFGITNVSMDIEASTSANLKEDLENLDGISPAVDFLIGFAF